MIKTHLNKYNNRNKTINQGYPFKWKAMSKIKMSNQSQQVTEIMKGEVESLDKNQILVILSKNLFKIIKYKLKMKNKIKIMIMMNKITS